MTELTVEPSERVATAVIGTPETAKKKAGPRARKPRVAATKAKATTKAIKEKKAPKAAPKAKGASAANARGARLGSKTEKILTLLKRPSGSR